MTTEPTAFEARLIDKIQEALQYHMKTAPGGEGVYFDNASLPKFQELAVKTAKLIDKQGVSGTFNGIVKAARQIQGLGETGYRNANQLAFAFKKHLDIPSGGTPNPFSGMQLQN